jgi:hypothetical protein
MPDRPWPRRQRSLEELDEDVVELRRDVRHVGERLDSAPFVRVDLHAEQLDRLRSDISSVRALTMWTLGILCSAIVGAILVMVVAVARGGP